MNYVIVAGYVCSGSSVVCDLLKEVNGFFVPAVEFKVIREPHGLIDLENKLVQNWNFFHSAHAIIEFEELIECFTNSKTYVYHYEKLFNKNFGEISREFIDSITSFSYEAGSSMFPNLLKKDKKKWFAKKQNNNIEKIKFSHINKQEFLTAVHDYLDKIFVEYKNDGYSSVVLDQGLSPNCANRINDYFPNGKMIVVDRDPRDVAVSMMRRKKGIGPELALEMNADKYIEWFKATRCNDVMVSTNVLYMKYEDLIHNYEDSKQKVFEFLNVEEKDHTNQFQYFNPDVSRTRIGQWKNCIHNTNEKYFFEQIEKHLGQYLYM